MIDLMEGLKRTHHCGQLTLSDIGREVVLMGWVNRRRDHGGLIFVDLRDRYGITQIVVSPHVEKESHGKTMQIRSEYVLAVVGKVSARPEGTKNPGLPTGDIEVLAGEMRILNYAETPPFLIEENLDVAEDIRLRYRYLDIRRRNIQQNLIMRSDTAKAVRDYLYGQDFLEMETPFLTKSTPEGARDYLVPSRVTPGSFYALPQSPQLFKQILMVGGYDRYFQIVKCFRDEDLRADRQPEFTQIDIELSFVDMEDILIIIEGLMASVFRDILGLEIAVPFKRLTYDEALDKYGTDKPDTRFGLELKDASDIFRGTDFKVFADAVDQCGVVKALNAPAVLIFPEKI